MNKNLSKLFFVYLLVFLISCELPPRNNLAANKTVVLKTFNFDQIIPDEEYVMVTTAVNMPMYVNHDQAAFLRWGKQKGVKVSILGPAEWDVPQQIEIYRTGDSFPTHRFIN